MKRESKTFLFDDGSIAAMDRVTASPDAEMHIVANTDSNTITLRMLAKDKSWGFEQTLDADETDAVIAALQKQRSKIS